MSDQDVFFSELAEDTQGQLGPQRDQGVRALAEEVAREIYGTSASVGTADVVTDGAFSRDVLRWEDRIRTFLAEQEPTAQAHAERDAATKTLAALRGALEEALKWYLRCRGEGAVQGPQPGADYPCPRCSGVRAALATDAGRLEAEVLGAAKEARSLGGMTDRLVAAVDALRAARGGEGPT